MQVYFNEFGKTSVGALRATLTPGKAYKVFDTFASGLHAITDDKGLKWYIPLDREAMITDSMWYVVPRTDAYPDIEPEVLSVGMVLREDNTCEAVMEFEGVLSGFTLSELETLYVNAQVFKAVADQLAETEKQLADIKSENTALAASIEHVNEILGPNADTDETLADKVKRGLLERGQEGFDQCGIGAKGGRMRPGRVPVVRDKNGEFVHPVFNLPENKGLFRKEVAEKYNLERFEAVHLDPISHRSFDNVEDPRGWFLVKSTYLPGKKIAATWFREYDHKLDLPLGI